MFYSEIEQKKKDKLRRDEIMYHVLYKILMTTPISIKCEKKIAKGLPITHWYHTIEDYNDIFYVTIMNKKIASSRVFKAVISGAEQGKEIEVYFSIAEIMHLIDKFEIQMNPIWME